MYFRTIEKKTDHSGLNVNQIVYQKLIVEIIDMEINGIEVIKLMELP